MSFIAVYITHGTERAAKMVSNYLIKKKVIACANIFPITSSYWWQQNIANEKEYVSLVKTTSENWDWLQKEVLAVHPYTTPCIMKIEVSANQAYEEWINDSVVTEDNTEV